MSVFLKSLDEIHSHLDVVWPEGREFSCCPNDGRHYAMKEFARPLSIGQVEARLIYNLCVSGGVARAFEIGTGFGYSSFWLGAAIHRNVADAGWLGSIDSYTEGGLGKRGLDFAIAGAKRLGLSRVVRYIVGRSPDDVGEHLQAPIDLALIDGNHRGTQPRRDYFALRQQLTEARFLLWHDVQAGYGVGDGIAAAIDDGWSPIVFPTSCRLCVCYRRKDDWDTAMSAFDRAQALGIV